MNATNMFSLLDTCHTDFFQSFPKRNKKWKYTHACFFLYTRTIWSWTQKISFKKQIKTRQECKRWHIFSVYKGKTNTFLHERSIILERYFFLYVVGQLEDVIQESKTILSYLLYYTLWIAESSLNSLRTTIFTFPKVFTTVHSILSKTNQKDCMFFFLFFT